ncbi:translation initiation factor IF-2 [Persicimonas caeni]|uniref:Translation initiation factor IF-2 n=1 Tax=Persicimonas caeni TaxID=2292766 RepID=A0A4Y6Q107_PERCE|nr:translation initiation factor IF-2 [Persicimonas caeni]QDG54261.1 translation initiation factor IF-2 [Persicimonas caeni]QED35482.1 translation initiation factor IF-2 [Persicimonas caeni]
MPSQRVYELAEELGFNRQELVTKINSLALGFQVNNYMTKLSPEEVSELKDALDEGGEGVEKAQKPASDGEQVEAAADDGGVAAPVVRRRRKKSAGEAEEADESGEAVAPTVRRRRRKVVAGAAEEAAEAEEAEEAAEVEEAEEAAEVEEVEEAEEAAEVEEAEEAAEVEEVEEAEEAAEVEEAEEAAEVEEAEEAAEAEEAEEAAEAEEAEEVAEAEEAEEAAEAEEVEEAEEAAEAEEAKEAKEAEKKAEAEEKPEKKAAKSPEADKTKKRSEGSRRRRKKEKSKGGARVLGQIDSNVVLDRLSAEGKDFSPGPSKKKSSGRRGRSSSGRSRGRSRKRVVEGRDLYKGGRRKKRRSRSKQRQQKTQITEAAEHKRNIRIEDVISVGDLAHQMGVKAGEVAMKLVESGMMATVNTLLDFETAALVADEFGYTVENVAFDITNFYDTSPDPEEKQKPRAPVVTVMGHVDHGKTSLLDAIRKSNVTGGEAGGITQHIGAYKVRTEEDSEITFLDTPGHEAFTQLRARGAKATDIVVLVIAADDGVMPQTVEAINHAREAGVPIIVAINKVDKPTANPDRIKQALTEYELIPEEWGGTTLFAEVSALQQQGIDELLEMLALQAEIEELKANPDRDAQGLIIEAELDIGRGPVATILVQRGSLKQGDIIVSGQYYGRVRTMHNDKAQNVEEVGPSTPVEITGLSGIPEAGEPFFVVDDEKDAKRITDHVAEQRRKEVMASRAKEVTGSLEDLSKMIQQGEIKELKVILKGDVQGSVEAIKEAFGKIGNEEVRVKVIHSGVGGITENDVNLAASSETGAVVVGFNVRPDNRAAEVAEQHGVKILTHSVIYDAINQISGILEGLLEPIIEEEVIGHAEVRELFQTPRSGMVAGCYVQDGILRRNAMARVVRDGRVVYDSTISSLRRFKDDVTEVKHGFECGLSIENFNDIKLGDIIEVYKHVEVAATL